MQTEWAAQLEQKIISQGEYNELMQQSGETLAAYAAQERALGDQRKALDEELAAIDTTTAQTIINNAQAQQEATQAAAEAEEAEMERRKNALQSYTEAATNMYDTINTKSELSVQQMIENMQQNQEILSAWADNLVALGERGLDQGLLQQLRDAGPESAATVAEMVTATDTQLQQLSEVYRAGGQAAANALQTELGLPEVTNSGTEMVNKIAEGVTNNTALTTATTQMIDKAVSSAKPKAMSGGQEIGKQLDNGIIAGVNAGKSGVINAMVQTVREAIAAAAAEAEIHSPSRVTEDFIGLNLMKGWARGEEKGTDLVIEKAKAAMDKVQQAFANGSLAPTQIVATMRAMVAANQSRLAVPVGVAAGSAAPMPMAQTIINMNNTFNTHDSLSEAELTDETEAMAERMKWKIP